MVLGPLVVIQWIAVAAFALTVRHNGWLYYQGGDETFYYSTSWLLTHGQLPQTPIGYGWSYLLAPIALFAGPNLIAALPALVLFQTVVLLPIALLCVYGIAARIGGRLIGYGAAALFVAAPYGAIPLFVERYHGRYVEQFLPQALGLSGQADFPSMVFLLLAAYFAFRALDTGDRIDTVLAGLAAGFAVGTKPANLLFLPAPLLAFALVRRRRELLLPFAAALAPALLTLAIWKVRGLGHIPAVTAPAYRLAAGSLAAAPEVMSIAGRIDRYLQIDWNHLHDNLRGIREFFWSERLVEWLPVAGLVAVARRSVPKAAFVGAWLAAFVVFKGSSGEASVSTGSFFRLLMPAWPAFLLLAVAIPFLVPTFGVRLAERFPPPSGGARRRDRRALALVVVLLFALPLVLIAALRPVPAAKVANDFQARLLLPVTGQLAVSATPAGRDVRLSWSPPATGSTKVFYRVLRSPSTQSDPSDPTLPPATQGIRCLPRAHGAPDCILVMKLLGTTPSTTWVDRAPPGDWTYRIGLAANWLNDPLEGDILMLSPSVPVTVS